MAMRVIIFLLFYMILVSSSHQTAASSNIDPDFSLINNPYRQQSMDAEREFLRTLTPEQKSAFMQLDDNSRGMSSIRMAQDSRSKLHAICTQKELDLAQQPKFDHMQQIVEKALVDQQRLMDASINSGVAGDPAKVKTIIELLRKADRYKISKAQEPPPPEDYYDDCLRLQDDEEHADKIVKMLNAQKWPQ
ncbi:MAG TPA: hypothetical protein VL625_08130 [Patescibacteria group bacterium]|jgi:hypothetical protein|nr:hypothetical protein [Patescibacteria group bacterium]